jgi:hypothetical protein
MHPTITIENSRYRYIEILEENLTINNLKKLILEKYNNEQKDIEPSIDNITITSYNSIPTLKVDLPENISNFIKENNLFSLNIKINNKNIIKRLDTYLKPPLITYSKRGYVKVIYHNASYFLYGTKEEKQKLYEKIITFQVINTNNDKTINIKTDEPHMLNYGQGPTSPQQYFKLSLESKKVYVYFMDNIYKNELFIKYKFKYIEDFLNNEIYESTYACTFSYDDTKCSICLDKNVDVLYLPCNHNICCNECNTELIKYNKCPLCRNYIDNYYYAIYK